MFALIQANRFWTTKAILVALFILDIFILGSFSSTYSIKKFGELKSVWYKFNEKGYLKFSDWSTILSLHYNRFEGGGGYFNKKARVLNTLL